MRRLITIQLTVRHPNGWLEADRAAALADLTSENVSAQAESFLRHTLRGMPSMLGVSVAGADDLSKRPIKIEKSWSSFSMEAAAAE